MKRIPTFDATAEIHAHWDAIRTAVEDVLKSGHFVLGPNVTAFERDFAAGLGTGHAIGVNSGTDALVLALEAAGIGPGDEVITTPFTFFATAEAIGQLGARPIFVDIDPATYCIDPDGIERAITPRTRAVLPVHLFGHPAKMDQIMAICASHRLVVVEDVAQAYGATHRGRPVGTFGIASGYSFFPTKNLGACGDAGMVTTDDSAIAERVRMLRAHGARRKYENEILGYNSRLDEIQAAILRVKLPRVASANASRRDAAKRYHSRLTGLAAIATPIEEAGNAHVFHQYTIRVPASRREAIRADLGALGIETAVYYPRALHQLPVYAGSGLRFPHAEEAAASVLSLPIWPGIAPEVVDRVAEAVIKVVQA